MASPVEGVAADAAGAAMPPPDAAHSHKHARLLQHLHIHQHPDQNNHHNQDSSPSHQFHQRQEQLQPTTIAPAATSSVQPAATDIRPPPTTVQTQLGRSPPHSLITSAAAALPIPTPASIVAASWAAEDPGRPAMIFSGIYKNSRSPLAKFRHQSIQIEPSLSASAPDWLSEEYADLLSKDKVKQKEAVRRYLAAKVRTDWEFNWPPHDHEHQDCTAQNTVGQQADSGIDVVPPTTADFAEPPEPVQDELQEDAGYQVDDTAESGSEIGDHEDNDDAESIYSVVSEDPVRFRPRMEWASDLSDDELEQNRSPFRFDNPETVGTAVRASVMLKRAKRRRDVRKEMEWNEGLACFEARRNAWTGAHTVRVKSKPVTSPVLSPRSPRRFFFRRSMSGSPPSSAHFSGDGSDGSSAKGDDKELQKQQTKDSTPSVAPDPSTYPVETLLPLAPPLLPPNNSLRASITPSVYLSLYEKVIIHNLQPSCPINLSDMLRSCVAGWKRDGEWPPRPTPAPAVILKKKKKPEHPAPNTGANNTGNHMARRMSFGLIGHHSNKEEESQTGKGIRRSLQRALGLNGTHDGPTPPA